MRGPAVPVVCTTGTAAGNWAESSARSVAGENLEAAQRPVPDVLVPREGAVVGPLPEGVRRPAGRQPADRAGVACDPQRAVTGEPGVVAGAGPPPVGGGVDDRPPAGPPVVLVDERADPAHHRGPRKAVAGSAAVRVVLDVEGARQRLAVLRPGPAVGGEVRRLRGAARLVRQCEVVGPADQSRFVGADVLLGEVAVAIG